jgi:hypothetical protein
MEAPTGQVRHEVAVHHIDVQPVGAVYRGCFVGEPGEIGGQEGRCYQRSRGAARHERQTTEPWARSSRQAAQRGGEHGVGAVPVWPKLRVGPLPETVIDGFEERPGIQRAHRVTAQRVGDHAHGFGQVR